MSKYQGLARVSIRCRPYQGVPVGTVSPLGYHPWAFNGNDGRSRADWHRRIRAEYASAKSINRVAFINGEQVEPYMIDGSLLVRLRVDRDGAAMTHLTSYYALDVYRGNRAAVAREYRRSRATWDRRRRRVGR